MSYKLNVIIFSFSGYNPLIHIFQQPLLKQSKLRSQIGKHLSPAMSPPSDGGKVLHI